MRCFARRHRRRICSLLKTSATAPDDAEPGFEEAEPGFEEASAEPGLDEASPEVRALSGQSGNAKPKAASRATRAVASSFFGVLRAARFGELALGEPNFGEAEPDTRRPSNGGTSGGAFLSRFFGEPFEDLRGVSTSRGGAATPPREDRGPTPSSELFLSFIKGRRSSVALGMIHVAAPRRRRDSAPRRPCDAS